MSVNKLFAVAGSACILWILTAVAHSHGWMDEWAVMAMYGVTATIYVTSISLSVVTYMRGDR